MANIKEFLARMSESGKKLSTNKKNKKLFISLFATILLVGAVIGIVTGVKSSKNNSDDETIEASHAIVKSSCSSTLYPDLCFSTLALHPEASKKVSSQKDVIELSLNITTTAVQNIFFTVEKLLKSRKKKLTKREKGALHDCLETIDETLDELHEAVEDLHEYPNKKTLVQHADDLKTLISSAITNQETCLNGFSNDAGDKKVRKVLLAGEVNF
ncbi:hypothetical protein C1H46_005707 [Malus baccata]|uniref:pectinesterase n=1 Tax=Malus baccata TaxID=106549 RepID=A0A540NDP0_MALBA|nr:hypothetical protein C1H46_005707 [Malus baccata]